MWKIRILFRNRLKCLKVFSAWLGTFVVAISFAAAFFFSLIYYSLWQTIRVRVMCPSESMSKRKWSELSDAFAFTFNSIDMWFSSIFFLLLLLSAHLLRSIFSPVFLIRNICSLIFAFVLILFYFSPVNNSHSLFSASTVHSRCFMLRR